MSLLKCAENTRIKLNLLETIAKDIYAYKLNFHDFVKIIDGLFAKDLNLSKAFDLLCYINDCSKKIQDMIYDSQFFSNLIDCIVLKIKNDKSSEFLKVFYYF